MVQTGVHSIKTFFTGTVTSIQELRELRSEYNQLRIRIGEYQKMEREYVALKAENDRLREQLAFTEKLEYSFTPAEIVAKDPSNLFDTFVISKGTADGAVKDMPVIAYQDGFQGLVGKIITAGRNTSTVLPLYSPGCYVAGKLMGSRYDGLISGIGNGTLKMEYVKKRAKSQIHYGDLVTTSGLNSIYPAGIYIGRIRDISAPDWMTSLEMEVEPIIDFGNLEYVYIVKVVEPISK